jgi:hypothetical protein
LIGCLMTAEKQMHADPIAGNKHFSESFSRRFK